MTRDETRGEIDLSLSIKDIEQSNADLLRIGGQVIERLAAVATPRTVSIWPSRSAVPIRFNIWWMPLA
jgi:hypothetical protein